MALVYFCLTGSASAEMHGQKIKWLRRATMIGACAASIWDFQTTRAGASYGARELNSAMADANGHPRFGLMLGAKLGMCLGSVVTQELMPHKESRALDPLWIGVNSALAARFATISIRNRNLTERLKREAASPPSYLAR